MAAELSCNTVIHGRQSVTHEINLFLQKQLQFSVSLELSYVLSVTPCRPQGLLRGHVQRMSARSNVDLYSALLWTSSLKCSDTVCDSKGITQSYLPPTHKPYLPLLPSPAQPHSITALWLAVNCAYPRRDGQAELTWLAGYILR